MIAELVNGWCVIVVRVNPVIGATGTRRRNRRRLRATPDRELGPDHCRIVLTAEVDLSRGSTAQGWAWNIDLLGIDTQDNADTYCQRPDDRNAPVTCGRRTADASGVWSADARIS